jgi:hypothetical protein
MRPRGHPGAPPASLWEWELRETGMASYASGVHGDVKHVTCRAYPMVQCSV